MANFNVDTGIHPIKDFFSTPVVTILSSIISTFAVAALFFRLTGPVPISVSQTSVDKQQPFQVTGQAFVSRSPDEANITLGITTQNQSVKVAQDGANSTINSISDSLKKMGVGESDIKTTNYSISPNYDYSNGRQTITGYAVFANLSVKFHDFGLLNQAIDTATSLGANQVGGISFTLSDEANRAAQKEARQQAVEQAKIKARDLADAAGIRLGKIINVTETSSQPPTPILQRSFALDAVESESTQLEPGSQEVTISVTLSYETL